MVSKGNHPQMAQLFKLVKYCNLPRNIYIYIMRYDVLSISIGDIVIDQEFEWCSGIFLGRKWVGWNVLWSHKSIEGYWQSTQSTGATWGARQSTQSQSTGFVYWHIWLWLNLKPKFLQWVRSKINQTWGASCVRESWSCVRAPSCFQPSFYSILLSKMAMDNSPLPSGNLT